MKFSSALASQRQSRKFMPEIQALRAIAVGLVVAFHLYPMKFFTGGFIGVDAFFVISGYLITGHLLREVERHGTINLPAFYAKRARRLLPASFLVLGLTLIASIFLMPVRYQLMTFREAIASTFYVENLWLAGKSVTYSASNDVASPLQHYWSLSTEEQFYLVWPALMILGLFLARKFFRNHTERTMAIVLSIIFLASLIHSIIFTITDTSAAYFITTTRTWQFAAGGLTAFFLRHWAPDKTLAIILRWVGLAALTAAGLLFSQATQFPGSAALVPTFATAVIIVAGDTGLKDPLTHIANLRIIQWIGDISYSIYLWHWPIIVLLPFAFDMQLRWYHKAIILAIVFLLAHFTRKYIEQPGQNWGWLKSSTKRTLLAMLAIMALIAGSAFGVAKYTIWHEAKQSAQLQNDVDTDQCTGAKAAVNKQCKQAFSAPARFEVGEQEAPWGHPGCVFNGTVTCWGDKPHPAKVMALVGDSHMESLYWAIKPFADQNGWGIVEIFSGGCPANYVSSDMWNGQPRDPQHCADSGRQATEILRKEKVNWIITTAYSGDGFSDEAKAAAGYQQIWSDWLQLAPITVIRDYPQTGVGSMPQCLASHDNQLDCSNPREKVLAKDLQFDSAKALADPRITTIDLTEAYCDDKTCYPVIGGLPVYYDADHIARSFSKSLAPVIASRLNELAPS